MKRNKEKGSQDSENVELKGPGTTASLVLFHPFHRDLVASEVHIS